MSKKEQPEPEFRELVDFAPTGGRHWFRPHTWREIPSSQYTPHLRWFKCEQCGKKVRKVRYKKATL